METIVYSTSRQITAAAYIELLRSSGLAERRPVDQPDTIAAMLTHANLLVTAWQGDRLVGASRVMTDFVFFAYLADLCVDRALQKSGIGRQLIRETQAALAPETRILLLSAPAAHGYYPKIGFRAQENAWILHAKDPLV
jgi:ribosomal protein S18 acetylase RimI-like enzyme